MAARRTGSVTVEIAGLPIRLLSDDPLFLAQIKKRYAGFAACSAEPRFQFRLQLAPPRAHSLDAPVHVGWRSGRWWMSRGDFRAEWNPAHARGYIRQTPSPYALDSVLRIVHSLLLAREGGFLVHASSIVRHGRAWIFAGTSGAGKTTIAKLAPAGVRLLTDEISYVIRGRGTRAHGGEGPPEAACRPPAEPGLYLAFGTPFAGELGLVGENRSAPIGALYLLAQGSHNSVQSVSPAHAVRGLLENILFFARDRELVERVFQAACDFVTHVPVHRLTFVPDPSVWELIP